LLSQDSITGENGALSKSAAIWLSVGLLAGGWVVYDLLWKFCKVEMLGIVISYSLIVGAARVCFHFFGPRGAYLQMGAMLGTIMAANVWMRILPPQRRMVAALKAGAEPNLAEAASGARLTTTYTRIGGLMRDIPPTWCDQVRQHRSCTKLRQMMQLALRRQNC